MLKTARFDVNNFRQYLGSATLVYENAAGAKRCIKDYNGAMLDDRVMTIEYATAQVQAGAGQTQAAPRPAAQQQVQVRRGPNAIQRKGSAG